MGLKRNDTLNWRMAKPAAALCAAMLVFFALRSGASVWKLDDFIKANYLDTLALIPVLTLLGLLAVIVGLDDYIRSEHKRTMRIIIAVVFSLVAQNYIEYRAAAGDLPLLVRTLASIYGYAVRPVILLLFWRLVAPEKRLGWAWGLVGANAAVHCTALFSHVCFWIDMNNAYQGGPLSSLCLYVSAILFACVFVTTIRVFKPRKRKETWVPVLVLLLIAAAILLDDNVGLTPQPVSYLTIAVVVSCVMYYIWLHLQFVREHEAALVAGQRVQLTLSQIKPHFLYNTLNAMKDLCDEDPEQVKTAIDRFARYLCGNMASIDQRMPISFEQELEHTRIYLEIEQMRFEEKLQVEYDIACMDFRIPALTLEPLVENAVRHGVRGNPGGSGTVVISTRKTPDYYEVAVSDDGPGFDPEQPIEDGRPHVGIANVRERLAQACGGLLKIESAPGKGTTATIQLPKNRGGSEPE